MKIPTISKKLIPMYQDLSLRIQEQSYCDRRKVGAILCDNYQIAQYGYNGTADGEENVCEILLEDGSTQTHSGVLHAEENCIINIANSKNVASDYSMFVTTLPCYKCAGVIVRQRIKEVFYIDTYRSIDGLQRLQAAGIDVYHVDIKNGYQIRYMSNNSNGDL